MSFILMYFYLRTSYSYTMFFPPIEGDNPRALASGLSTVQVDETCINLTCNMIPSVDLDVTGYLVLKIWVSWDWAINSGYSKNVVYCFINCNIICNITSVPLIFSFTSRL